MKENPMPLPDDDLRNGAHDAHGVSPALPGDLPPLGATVTVYGASDDLVEVDGPIKGADEFSYPGNDKPWVARLRSKEANESLLIFVAYVAGGTWAVGIAPVDDDTPIPFRWLNAANAGAFVADSAAPDYSAVLRLSVPVDTKLKVLTRG